MADDPVNKWNQPESAPPPMFFGKKERDLVKQVNDELAERVIGQTIAYYSVSLEDSDYHPIYGEAIDKVTLAPVRVYAYVTVENEQTNERYGYEYQTKLTVNFHRKRITEDQNLFVRVGDFVQYGDEFYEIARTYNDTRYYFGQVEHKFQISAECIKARKGTFRIRGEMKPQIVTSAPGAAVPALPIPSPPPAVPRAPNNAQYVVLEADDNLTKERVLTAGSNISLTDAGAGSTLTIDSTGGGSPSGSTVVYSGTGLRTSGYLSVTGSTTLQAAISSSAGATFVGSVSSSGDVAVTGNVHAATFYGSAAGLTGISSDAVDVTSSAGDISYKVTFTEGFQSDGTLGLGGNTGLVYNPNDGILSSSAGAQIVGNSIFGGTLGVSGATTLAATASVGSIVATGSISGSSTLQTVGATTLGSTLNVSGAITAKATGSFSSVTMTGSLSGSHTAVFGSSISSSADVAVTGNVHAATYYGDGSNLTGVDSVSGSSRHYSATGFETSGYLKVTGSTTLAGDVSSSSGARLVGSVSSSGDVAVTGNVHAAAYYGDGSNLTGVDAVSGSSRHYSATGLETSGYLKVTGSTTLAGTGSVSSLVATGSISGSSTLEAAGATTLGSTLHVSGNVGIGTDSPTYALDVAGDVGFDEYIYHNGDTDTYIRFRGDQIDFVAGNMTFLTLDESAGSSPDTVAVNNGANDIDFQVQGAAQANLIRTDAANDRVGIGTDTPSHLLTVAGSMSGSSTLQVVGAATLGSTLAVSGAATLAATGSFSSVNMTGSLSGSHTAVFGSSISSSGDVAVTGNVHAAAYYGDGANLTNVGVSGSARHYSATGFETSGYLRVSGSTTLAGTGSVSSIVATGSISGSSTLEAAGATTLGSTLNVTGAVSGAVGFTGASWTSDGAVSSSAALYGTDLVLKTNAASSIASIYIEGTNGTEIIGLAPGNMDIRSDGGSLNLLGGAGNALHLGSDNDTYRVILDTDGNLGIGTVTPSDTLTVVGGISGSSTLQAVGAATLGSTLAVSGAATLGATGSFSSVNMTGSLSGSHTAVFGSSISSSGDIAVTGNAHAAYFYGNGSGLTNISADGVDVTSSTGDLSYKILFTEDFQSDGSLGLGGNTGLIYNPNDGVLSSSAGIQIERNSIFGGNLNVSGATRFADQVRATDISASATLQVVGSTIIGSSLGLSGSFTLIDTLSSSAGAQYVGESIFGDTLNVSGTATFADQIAATSISASNTLEVVDEALFGGDLRVSGATLLADEVEIGGTLSGSNAFRTVGAISSSSDIAVSGNAHATTYYGDGSNLTGIGASTASGSARHYSATGLETSGYLKVTGSTTLGGAVSSSAGASLVTSISSSGDLAVTGNVHAAIYYGDGSNLSGIAGNVSGSARHYSSTGLETSGYLKVSGSTTLAGTGSVSSLVATGSISGSSTLEAAGAAILGSSLGVSGSATFAAAMIYNRSAITAATYTIQLTDYIVGADPSSNAIQLTLPAASSAATGQSYLIKDEGGAANTNAITIMRAGSDTIDGETSVAIDSPYGALGLYTDGSNWFIY